MQIHRADHVLPISSEPLTDASVVIDGDSIVAVGPNDPIRTQFPTAEFIDHGSAAIMPGLVNCHTHLELTAMRGRLDRHENDFRSWLLELNSIRESMTDDEVDQAAIDGIREGFAAGVTCFADIGRRGKSGMNAMLATGCRGTLYQETAFSPDSRTANDDFRELIEKFVDLSSRSTDLVRVGISPHSPYTVSSALFEMLAQAAIIDRIPLAIHAAESDDEIALLRNGEGFFVGVYEKFGVEWEHPACSPIEYLERLGVLAAQPLLVHCVKATGDDLRRIANYGATIAHCPRSNAKFGHGWASFEPMLEMEIAVGLGSDSVASNNVCDILAESTMAVFAARNNTDRSRFLTAKDALYAATLGGASALRMDEIIGSIEPGKKADLAVIDLSADHQQPITDVEAAIVFSSTARDIKTTIVAGNVVYDRLRMQKSAHSKDTDTSKFTTQ